MFSRTWQVIVKELLHFRRDRVLTIFIFVFPMLQLILVAQAAGIDVANLPLAVWDQDYSASSRQIMRAMDSTTELSLRYLHIKQAKTGVLDAVIEHYVQHYESSPIPFMTWVEQYYDHQAIESQFKIKPWAQWLVDGILRRE
jgi:hypothetical protein